MSDIAALLYGIKQDISSVESGERSDAVLSELRADCAELLELIKLFLISERDSYYGYFLMNLRFSIDLGSKNIAGIKLNTYPPVFLANPLLLCKFTLKEIIFIACHEIDHIVLNHPAEMVRLNPAKDKSTFEKFNLAADASVNERINLEIKQSSKAFISAPKGIVTSSLLKKSFGLRSILPLESYLYYFNLIKDSDKDGPLPQPQAMLGEFGEDDGERAEEYGGDIVTADAAGAFADHDWDAGDDAEEAAAAARELVNAAVSMMSDEARGLMPGFFLSQVEQINKPPELPWQAILKKYIGTITAGKRKTRTRLNRRQPERFDISGAVDERVLKIVVAIDTSGSVSDEAAAGFINEIFAIIAKRRHSVIVIECDCEVRRVYAVRSPGDIKSITGRGGTAFTPVIEYVNADRFFRDALLVYFTDGFGESEIPKPKTYRNLWVVLGKASNLSVENPYGAVAALQS